MVNVFETPPPGAAADWTIPQQWERYTEEEHRTWDALFERQARLLPDRVVPEFMEGLRMLKMDERGIPNFEYLSERLMKATGWQVVAVPGLVPDRDFFEHLANRRFVSGRFIRRKDQIDYLREGGLRADDFGAIDRLARIYWYTVEFGLMQHREGLKLFGAGIVSSYSESVFALDDPSPNRIAFDLKRVMRTKYRIDDFQQTYFVVDSFEDLLRETLETDFAPLYRQVASLSDLEVDSVATGDQIFTLGTQAYATAKRAADETERY
jgi:phenylalanine-4-hydroxylase